MNQMKNSEEKMRAEMKEIHTAMEAAMANKNKELARERKTSSTSIKKLESRILELELDSNDIDKSEVNNENIQLRRQIARLEEYYKRKIYETQQRNFDLDHDDHLETAEGAKHYTILWRAEKDKRLKAEEFAAAMAARAKAGFEDRDEKILHLRMRISNLETENKNVHRLPLSSSFLSVPIEKDLTLALVRLTMFSLIKCSLSQQFNNDLLLVS